jgi:hypothetical protein
MCIYQNASPQVVVFGLVHFECLFERSLFAVTLLGRVSIVVGCGLIGLLLLLVRRLLLIVHGRLLMISAIVHRLRLLLLLLSLIVSPIVALIRVVVVISFAHCEADRQGRLAGIR